MNKTRRRRAEKGNDECGRPVRVRSSGPGGVFAAVTGAGRRVVAGCCSAEALQTPPGPALPASPPAAPGAPAPSEQSSGLVLRLLSARTSETQSEDSEPAEKLQ